MGSKQVKKILPGIFEDVDIDTFPELKAILDAENVNLPKTRADLKDAVIAILHPPSGDANKSLYVKVYRKAKELGIKTMTVSVEDDENNEWCKQCKEEGLITKFWPVSPNAISVDTMFEECCRVFPLIQAEFQSLDGIITWADLHIPTVGRLAEKFKLPGNAVAGLDAARNKDRLRDLMKDAGLPSPRFAALKERGEKSMRALQEVGFPMVVKPPSGGASIGVTKVSNVPEFMKALGMLMAAASTSVERHGSIDEGARAHVDMDAAIEAHMRSVSLQGPPSLGPPAIASTTLATAPSVEVPEGAQMARPEAASSTRNLQSSYGASYIVVEEYMDGAEVDIDVVLCAGRPVYASVVDNWPTEEPWFFETGGNLPSLLPAQQQREMVDLSLRTLKLMGAVTGVFHCEGKYTSRGPRLIEINCRMGHGPIYEFHKMVYGVDMVEMHFKGCCGVPIEPPASEAPKTCAALYIQDTPVSGVITSLEALDPWKTHPDVVNLPYYVKVGERVEAPGNTAVPTMITEILVARPTPQAAYNLALEIKAQVAPALTAAIVP